MDQEDLNKKFFTAEESPAPLPSTDLAWQQMHKRLDNEMPEKKRKKWFIIFFLLLALLGGIFMKDWLNGTDNGITTTKTPKQNSVEEKPGNTFSTDKDQTVSEDELSLKKDTAKLVDQKNDPAAIDPSKNASAPKGINITADDQEQTLVFEKNKIAGNNKNLQLVTIHNKQKKKQHYQNISRGSSKQHITVGDEDDDNKVDQSTSTAFQKNINVTVSPGTGNDSLSSDTPKNIQAPPGKTTDSLDIALEKEAEEVKPADEKTIFKGGLQWNLQIPMAGGGKYFTGSNLNSQPYLVLIPGIWTSVQLDKLVIAVELNPYFTTLLPSKNYTSFISSSSITDTVHTVTETRQLNKLIGTAVAASFGYNVTTNLWVKGGIQAQWWRKGIATANTHEEKYPVGNSAEKTFSTSSHLIAVENPDWTYFNKFQVNLNAEAMYTLKKWEAAFRIGLPIAPITQSGNGPKNSVRTELILRYQLFKK